MAGLQCNRESDKDALRKRLCLAEKLEIRALKLNESVVGMNRLQKQIKAEMAVLAKVGMSRVVKACWGIVKRGGAV